MCAGNRRIAGGQPTDNRLSTQRADESLCEHALSAVREAFEQQRVVRENMVIRSQIGTGSAFVVPTRRADRAVFFVNEGNETTRRNASELPRLFHSPANRKLKSGN
jgi:hypothetical protein